MKLIQEFLNVDFFLKIAKVVEERKWIIPAAIFFLGFSFYTFYFMNINHQPNIDKFSIFSIIFLIIHTLIIFLLIPAIFTAPIYSWRRFISQNPIQADLLFPKKISVKGNNYRDLRKSIFFPTLSLLYAALCALLGYKILCAFFAIGVLIFLTKAWCDLGIEEKTDYFHTFFFGSLYSTVTFLYFIIMKIGLELEKHKFPYANSFFSQNDYVLGGLMGVILIAFIINFSTLSSEGESNLKQVFNSLISGWLMLIILNFTAHALDDERKENAFLGTFSIPAKASLTLLGRGGNTLRDVVLDKKFCIKTKILPLGRQSCDDTNDDTLLYRDVKILVDLGSPFVEFSSEEKIELGAEFHPIFISYNDHFPGGIFTVDKLKEVTHEEEIDMSLGSEALSLRDLFNSKKKKEKNE